MAIAWLRHGGHRVFLLDLRNFADAEAADELREARSILKGSGEAPALGLLDLTDAKLGSAFMQAAKLGAPTNGAVVRRLAVVGAAKAEQLLVASFNLVAETRAAAFATRDEALDYLAAE
jgi:hypothetical protein